MAGSLEAAHIGTDLGQNCRRRHRTDPRDRGQQSDQVAKGDLATACLRFHALDPLSDFDIKLANRLIQTIPLLQVKREQKAMVIRQAPMQRIVKLLWRRLELLAGKLGQLVRLPDAVDHRLDDPPPVRASARSSCTFSSGMKLPLISPQANRSAIHIASFMSVLRPGTFLICAALATISSKAPSPRIRNTGIQ